MLTDEKSKIIHVSVGFDFVSRHYAKHSNHIFAYLTQQSVYRFENNVSETIYNRTGRKNP